MSLCVAVAEVALKMMSDYDEVRLLAYVTDHVSLYASVITIRHWTAAHGSFLLSDIVVFAIFFSFFQANLFVFFFFYQLKRLLSLANLKINVVLCRCKLNAIKICLHES